MGVFFNGRLWVSPATMSAVDDSAMFNKNPSVGNVLVLVGKANGGEPFKALRFGGTDQARAVLRSGEMLKAVEKAFDPSAQTSAPSEVICVRVNPALQSGLALLDGAGGSAISLASTGYGLPFNNIKVKVESGSIRGKKLTSQFGNDYYSADNVSRNAFSLQYVGAEATATIAVTGNKVTLEAPVGTVVADIDLETFAVIGDVVDRINATSGFHAAVLDGNSEKAAFNGLDYVSDQDVKTAEFVVTANLQAAVDWFNGQGEGFVNATRVTGAGAAPANLPFTYLAGGSDGLTTFAEWQAAYDVVQGIDAQWVVPISSNPAIHAMNDTHVSFMSNVARKERRGIVGTDVDTSDDAALLAAKNLNSDRTSLVHLGFYDYNEKGKLTLFPPYILAAQLAGGFAGVNPGTALTNKTIKVRGLERDLRNPTDTDRLILGGVLCVENTEKGYKVVKSISTWITTSSYNKVEVSVGVASDFVMRNVRNILDDLRGLKGTPELLSQAVSRTDSMLRELAKPEPMGPAVIVGDKLNPAYKNIVASIDGDAVSVEFQCSPVIPCNYIKVVAHMVPFSGSASA